MHIRKLDPHTDSDGLRECVIEIQDYERALVPSMPEGSEICDAYTQDIIEKCTLYAGYIYVAVENSTVIGYTTIYTKMTSLDIEDGDKEFGLIGDLVVLKAYRGRGFGALLMDKAERIAREKGVQTLRIGVLHDNTVAADLYRTRGYKPFSLLMEKSL